MQPKRQQATHFESHGERVAGCFFPSRKAGKRPCIVLAHGLAGIKEMRLDAYAERFAEAGYNALTFDYRHFGGSDGKPRQLVDIGKQHADWHAAISHARGIKNVDAKKIVLWGSSLSGGHVMVVAGQDPSVAAVISQVPHTHGPMSALSGGVIAAARLTMHGLVDALNGALGLPPHYVDASGQPGDLAILSTPGSRDGYFAMLPKKKRFDQRVAARFLLAIPFYSPGRFLRHLSMPTLVQVALNDTSTPAGGTVDACRDAPKVTLKIYATGHFDPYVAPLFETIVSDQLAFLDTTFTQNRSRLDDRLQ